jgi:tetratricopeptide (TPR) repeat protein
MIVLQKFALLLSLATITAHAQNASMEVNPTLFAVMAAINAAGYDADLESPSNSPVRKLIRQYIAEKKPASLDLLTQFYASHRKSDPARDLSQYISFALCLEKKDTPEGPDFRYRLRRNELPPDVQELDGFELLLTRFYRETKLGDLIAANEQYLDRALSPYHEPVTLGLQQISGYLRNPRDTGTKGEFKVYLDVLGAPNQIHVRSYANDFYVVITSSPEPQVEYVKNAYMHFVVDPIAMRSIKEIEAKSSLIDFAQGAPALDDQYKKDFALLTVASLTKAVEARMAPPSRRAAIVETALREGFILTPYFAESLIDYEKQEQSMRFYLPILIQGIDLKRESDRLDGTTFASAPRERKAKLAPRPSVARDPAEQTLEQAEKLYEAKDFTGASELFRRMLSESNAPAMKARAYFGLARIAAASRDPELAVQMFEKTIETGTNAPNMEGQVLAWSHVFLGRLLDLAQEPDNARKHFEAALATPGATTASKKAAEDGLKGVRPQSPPR